jgi:hypothetical protein
LEERYIPNSFTLKAHCDKFSTKIYKVGERGRKGESLVSPGLAMAPAKEHWEWG